MKCLARLHIVPKCLQEYRVCVEGESSDGAKMVLKILGQQRTEKEQVKGLFFLVGNKLKTRYLS